MRRSALRIRKRDDSSGSESEEDADAVALAAAVKAEQAARSRGRGRSATVLLSGGSKSESSSQSARALSKKKRMEDVYGLRSVPASEGGMRLTSDAADGGGHATASSSAKDEPVEHADVMAAYIKARMAGKESDEVTRLIQRRRKGVGKKEDATRSGRRAEAELMRAIRAEVAAVADCKTIEEEEEEDTARPAPGTLLSGTGIAEVVLDDAVSLRNISATLKHVQARKKKVDETSRALASAAAKLHKRSVEASSSGSSSSSSSEPPLKRSKLK
eukprot:PLAT15829.1.p1 GENE.PLAT15829.1~~PLAT15829.1.p1  ORF type:complete len:280 (+),score=85.93 PLAT15829.1:22-840(+)